jgi:hypothetical protein
MGGGTSNSGTYQSTDTFSFDVLLTFSGYDAVGLSFWLETATAFAGNLSITGVTYGTVFPDPNQIVPDPAPFDVLAGASPGFFTEARDLGSTADPPYEKNAVSPGTYLVAHVSFAITNAAPGNYVIQLTSLLPRKSEVSDTDFQHNPLPAAQYFITIVPEPRPAALVGCATAIGLAVVGYRRFRRGQTV